MTAHCPSHWNRFACSVRAHPAGQAADGDLVLLQVEAAEQFSVALDEPRRHLLGARIALDEVGVFVEQGTLDLVERQVTVDDDDIGIGAPVELAGQSRPAGPVLLEIAAVQDVDVRRHVGQPVFAP